MTHRCDQCEAWNALGRVPGASALGQCRRRPPVSTHDDGGEWPVSNKDDWCSEFGVMTEERYPSPIDLRDGEERELADLVRRFADSMLTKLLAKKRQGWHGWNGSCQDITEQFWQRMNACAAKWSKNRNRVDQLVDVANFCAFIWNLPPGRTP